MSSSVIVLITTVSGVLPFLIIAWVVFALTREARRMERMVPPPPPHPLSGQGFGPMRGARTPSGHHSYGGGHDPFPYMGGGLFDQGHSHHGHHSHGWGYDSGSAGSWSYDSSSSSSSDSGSSSSSSSDSCSSSSSSSDSGSSSSSF